VHHALEKEPPMKKSIVCFAALCASLTLPTSLLSQSKPLKEVRVPYALGGSTSFFWVAQRSGSFEKYGLKVLPIFMRGLADGMDFYRHEKNKDAVHKYLGEFYKSNNIEELEETRRVYTQVTPGLPIVTLKAMENMIASDRMLSTMNINGADVMDLSFLKQLEEERKLKK
jgi:hypothetical protein